MAQISAVQFNGSNAYELLVGEFVSSWPIGAVGFTDIAVGVQVYTATVSAGVKLTLRSFNAAGAVLSAQDFTYTVINTSMWERAETTWTCPTGIDRAELRITAVGGTVLFAQPKLERGTEVGEYSTNYAPQLTLLTPTGIYTGTLTAQQVIVSPLSGATEKDLESRLVTINSNAINLRATTDNNVSRLTTIEAGQITLRSDVDGALPKITKLTAGGVYTGEVVASQITTGILKSANNYSQINLNDGTFSFGNGALAWNGASLVAKGSFESTGDTQTAKMDDGSFRLVNGATDMGYLSVQSSELTGPWLTAAGAATTITLGKVIGETLHMSYRIQYPNASSYNATHTFYGPIIVETINTSMIKDLNGNECILTHDGSIYLLNPLGVPTFSSNNSSTLIQYAAHSGALGVDSAGPFYITNAGVKKYLT